jgi:hypothetical protein
VGKIDALFMRLLLLYSFNSSNLRLLLRFCGHAMQINRLLLV